MRVLVLEGAKPMAQCMTAFLGTLGHEVTGGCSVRYLNPLTGVSPEGVEFPINARNYDIVFCDGNLDLKGDIHGPHVVGAFVQAGVVCVGMNVLDTENGNTAMRAKGAKFAFNKLYVFAGLVSGLLTCEGIVSGDGASLQAMEAQILERFQTDTTLRDKLNELIARYFGL